MTSRLVYHTLSETYFDEKNLFFHLCQGFSLILAGGDKMQNLDFGSLHLELGSLAQEKITL